MRAPTLRVSLASSCVVVLAALLAPHAARAQRTSCCSVKVITRASDDPNDLISPVAVAPLTVKLGTIDAVTCDGDESCGGDAGQIRVPIAPGRYRVSVPREELDTLGFRVGYISIAPTSTGVVRKCFPNTTDTDPSAFEGNVELVVDAGDFNPTSLSDYELGVRLVPAAAPPLQGPPNGEGVTCPAGSTGGGGGDGGGGGNGGGKGDKADRKRPDVADIVGPWAGTWKDKKLGTSGTASAEVSVPEDGTVQINTTIVGSILRCATELVENPVTLRSGTDYAEDPTNGNITSVDFTRTNNVFGDVHVAGDAPRKLTASAPTTCGGLGPAFEATGKINKKFNSASVKFQLTFPDGEKAKASVVVGKQQ